MDEEELLQPSFGLFFYGALAIVFGWGSLWIGNYGYKLAFGNGNNQSGRAYSSQTANIKDATIIGTNKSQASTTLFFDEVKNIVNFVKTNSAGEKLTILIGGDMMFDRNIRILGDKYGYDSLLASITPLFNSVDLAVANLEGPITANKSKTVLANGKTTKELAFTFDPKSAGAISRSGLDIVSLANNHTDNFGPAGLKATRDNLKKANVDYFGDYANSTSTYLIVHNKGMNIAFVGYHAFYKGFDNAVQLVKELHEKGNFVIVMPHWGEEYATSSSPKIKEQARTLVSAGAGAIMGSHPHVVLERVKIGDVPVFYSLGNLLFDQYFSPEVMRGNAVLLTLVKNGSVAKIDDIKIYETSTQSHKTVTYDPEPLDF